MTKHSIVCVWTEDTKIALIHPPVKIENIVFPQFQQVLSVNFKLLFFMQL